MTHGTIMRNLCCYSLDEEALVWELQPFLQHQMVIFVHQLIDVTAHQCGEQILRQLELLEYYAAKEQEDSPMATSGPTVSPGGPPAPNPRVQKELHEELGQVVPGPSPAGQKLLAGEPQHVLKRRASVSSASLAHKRPRHSQH